MMPDKLRELLNRGPALEPEQPPKPDITQAIADAADRVIAGRVIIQQERKQRMSLLGKLQHITESAQDFDKKTEATLDGIAEKIALGNQKREEAEAKHHAYYDAVIAGVEDSLKVIDRLSNGPLPEGGGS